MTTDREALQWLVQHLNEIGVAVEKVDHRTGTVTVSIHSPVTRRYDSTGRALPQSS